jgi:hypothetical protein
MAFATDALSAKGNLKIELLSLIHGRDKGAVILLQDTAVTLTSAPEC